MSTLSPVTVASIRNPASGKSNVRSHSSTIARSAAVETMPVKSGGSGGRVPARSRSKYACSSSASRFAFSASRVSRSAFARSLSAFFAAAWSKPSRCASVSFPPDTPPPMVSGFAAPWCCLQ